MNDRVRHGADQAQAFAAHYFRDEMRVDVPQPFRDAAEKIHVQLAGRELKNMLEGALVHCPENSGFDRCRHGGVWTGIE